MSHDRPRLQLIGVVLLWLVTVWEALTMGAAGFAKFGNPEVWARWFDTWGYPAWFMPLVGGVELLGALLLLAPPIAAYAAMALMGIMLGALFTVVMNESGSFTVTPILMHMVGLSIVLWFRRPDRLRTRRTAG